MFRLLRHSAWLAAVIGSGMAMAADSSPLIRDDWPFAQTAQRAHDMSLGIENHVEPIADQLSLLFGPAVEVPVRQALGNAYTALDALVPARRTWARVEHLATLRKDDALRLDALNHKGELGLQAGDSTATRHSAEQLLALAQRRGDRRNEATAWRQLGVIQRRSGDLDKALEAMQHGLVIARETGDAVIVGVVLNAMGSLHRDRGDFAKALESHLEALDIRLRTGDRVDTSYRNIALLYREIDDGVTVNEYLERALAVARQRGNPLAFSPILGSYSVVLNDAGEYARALDAAEQGLVIDGLSGNRSAIGFNEIEKGRALIGLGRTDEGAASLQKALATGRELGLREIIARALLPMSELAIVRKDMVTAQRLLDEAAAVVQESQLRPQLLQAYELQERLALLRNDLRTALDYAHRYGEQRELLVGTRASRQLTELKVRNARVDSEHLLTLLQKDNELQSIRLRAQGLEQRLTILATLALAILAVLAFWRHYTTRRLNRDLRQKNTEIEAQRAILSEVNDRLRQQANDLYAASIHDSLTGAYNRGHLIHHLNDAVKATLRRGGALSLLMIDFDHFKAINDSRGHLYGDAVLVTAVQAMADALTSRDLLARFGGEEFVIVLGDQDTAEATTTAEMLRRRVEYALQRFDATGRASTISVGVASLSRLQTPSMDALIDAADRAVYRAKAQGRNRVVIAEAERLGTP